MLRHLTLLSILATLVSGQDCPAITASVFVDDALPSPTISAGTSATVVNGALATVLTCAQASVQQGGIAIVSGGTVSLQGARTTIHGTDDLSYSTNLATATAISAANIAQATYASVSVDYSRSVVIGPSASAVIVDVDINARAIVEAGATSAVLIGRAPGAKITARGVSFGEVQAKVDSYIEATFVEGPNIVSADANARVSAMGPAVTAFVAQTEWYGQVTITGADASCTVGREGQCTISGDRAQATASGFRASVEVQGGSGGTVLVTDGGTASIAGANTALVASAGIATIGSGAAATVGSRGFAVISPGNGDVFVQPTGYASLEAGATVFLGPQATASVAPGTSLTSIGTRDDYRLLSAMGGPSALRRRAADPLPTCAMGMVDCPNVNGGVNCVNIDSDISNCGGCAFEGLGVDCTTIEGFENVACRAGQCVEI